MRPDPPPPPAPGLSALVCGSAEHSLIFAPANLVDDVRRTRAAMEKVVTWDDARRLLTPQRYAELLDELLARVDPDPSDDEPLDQSDLSRPGEWPCLFYSQVVNWLPVEIIEEHGEYFSTMMDTGVIFDAEDGGDAVCGALEEAGISVRWDDRLDELFVDTE